MVSESVMLDNGSGDMVSQKIVPFLKQEGFLLVQVDSKIWPI
jgi:hypothetical protein